MVFEPINRVHLISSILRRDCKKQGRHKYQYVESGSRDSDSRHLRQRYDLGHMTTTRNDIGTSLFIYVKDVISGKVNRLAIPSDTQVGTMDNPAELRKTH